MKALINYDLPLENESYVHRTGRTGRAGHSGKAISFATPNEEKFVLNIEKYIGFEIPRKTSPPKEAVAQGKAAFEAKLGKQTAVKKDRGSRQDVMKLYFNSGKKKKIRAVDFVGTIARSKAFRRRTSGLLP